MNIIRYSAVATAVAAGLLTFSPMTIADDLSQQNAKAIEEIRAKLETQNNAEIEQLKRDLETQKDEAVQWHGYFRAGFTSNDSGSASNNTTIKAPNAGAFYRLGGGESNYAAWNLSRKFNVESGAWAKAYFGLVYEDRDARRWVYDTSDKTVFMDKAYVEMGNLDFAPDATFWAGRVNWGSDIHILDRKYYEVRSPGIGVKGLDAGDGKIDLFMMAHDTDSDTEYTDENGTTVSYDDGARPRTHTIGLEYKKGNWWIATSVQSNSNDEAYQVSKTIDGNAETYDAKAASFGAHIMLNYKQNDFFGMTDGSTRYVAQYGTGVSAAFLGRNGDTNQSNEDGQNYRFFIDGLTKVGDWDINTVALIQQKNDVDFDGSKNTWWTIGARPSYYVTENFAMQFEAGYNWSSYESDTQEEEGGLATFTIAPTLKLKSSFFNRPELRLYATYAKYTGDYTASSLDGFDSDDDSAFTFGAQAEIWF